MYNYRSVVSEKVYAAEMLAVICVQFLQHILHERSSS